MAKITQTNMATDNAIKLFEEVEEIASKIQKCYFEHERFFDHINGAGSLDNASGWTYDFYYAMMGKFDDQKTRSEFEWIYDAFDSVVMMMERNGAGVNGGARGISYKIQYIWGLAATARKKIEEIARETGVSFSKGVAICVYN